MSAASIQAAVSARFDPTAEPVGGNEFVIFSKPELGHADLDTVWDLFAAAFDKFGVRVHAVAVKTGAELAASRAMALHYGVINQISTLGRPALTEATEAELVATYGERLADADVLGGHQFLDRFPDFTAYALAVLFANAPVTRLGPGTYAAQVNLDGRAAIILNGFHPRQLGFFTAADTVCAFLHASSDTDWATLRTELIGTTNPANALPTSIRGTLKADPGAFGLTAVNSNFNGVHMSAGPLEGLVELGRFFGDGDWRLAADLAAAGADTDRIAELSGNPLIRTVDGVRGSAFDLTEELNSTDAATLLATAAVEV